MTKSKIHFIGICGAGLSALAVLLKDAGYRVSGSDSNFFEPVSGYLRKNKINFHIGYSAKNIPEDTHLVVLGKNVHLSEKSNPETRAAVKGGITIKSLPEVLALLSRRTENTVVIGSFGKSTITAILSWCLIYAKRDPSYFIGALPIDFEKSAHLGKGNNFVLEGDEYPSSNTDSRSKFLHLNPYSVLLISGEHDHVNVFPTEKSYLESYKKFIEKIPATGLLVYAKNAKNTVTLAKNAKSRRVNYALSDTRANWYAQNIKYGPKTSFDLMHNGTKVISIKTSLLGKHNIENIVGAGALLLENSKITPALFARAISGFHGIKRRIELLGKGKVPVYEGFGSSYEKTRAIFEALKLHFPGRRLVVVFEPHAFSWRNKKFLHWYKKVFRGMGAVVMLPATSRGKLSPSEIKTDEIWKVARKYYPIHTAKNEKGALTILKAIVKKNDIVVLVSSGSLFGLTKSVPRLLA